MVSRRQTLKTIGAGTGVLFVQGTALGEEDGSDDTGLERWRSHFVTVDLHVEDPPGDHLPISGPCEGNPYKMNGNGTVFVSAYDRYENLDRNSDFVVATSTSKFMSKDAGEDLSFGNRPSLLKAASNEYFLGTLDSSLDARMERPGNGHGAGPGRIVVETRNDRYELRANDELTIDEEYSITYRTAEREEKSFVTRLDVTFDSKGPTQIVGHPEYQIFPVSHRSAEYAEQAYQERQKRGAPVHVQRDSLEVKRDAKYGAYLLRHEFDEDRTEEVQLEHEKEDPMAKSHREEESL